LLFLMAGLLAGTAAARSGSTTKPIVFPVLGAARYTGRLRRPPPRRPASGDRHGGREEVGSRLAAEAGKVKFWTTSASAGCMLYLYGASGTTYFYIHLNNDLTRDKRRPRQVRRGHGVRDGAQGRREGRGRPARRLRRRLRGR